MRNNSEDQKSKEFRQTMSISHYFFLMNCYQGILFRVLNEKTQGINLEKCINYELEQNLWIYPYYSLGNTAISLKL